MALQHWKKKKKQMKISNYLCFFVVFLIGNRWTKNETCIASNMTVAASCCCCFSDCLFPASLSPSSLHLLHRGIQLHTHTHIENIYIETRDIIIRVGGFVFKEAPSFLAPTLSYHHHLLFFFLYTYIYIHTINRTRSADMKSEYGMREKIE